MSVEKDLAVVRRVWEQSSQDAAGAPHTALIRKHLPTLGHKNAKAISHYNIGDVTSREMVSIFFL